MADTAGSRITVEPQPGRVTVAVAGTVIADSRRALRLLETGHKPVVYVPREDVAMEHFTRSARVTHCPWKGDAAHYDIAVPGGETAEAAWSYEAPIDAVADIRGHLAFYPNRVDAIGEAE